MNFYIAMKKVMLLLLGVLPCTLSFSKDTNGIGMEAQITRSCTVNIPAVVEISNISSANLINTVPGIAIGTPEAFDVVFDCGTGGGGLVVLNLQPAIVDGACIGINESIKLVRLCLQHDGEEIDLAEESGNITINLDEESEQSSEIVTRFSVTPEVGQDQTQEKVEGTYTAFLNVMLNIK